MKEKDRKQNAKASCTNLGAVFTVSENGQLLAFLLAQMPFKSRNKVKSLLHNKRISVNGKTVSQFDYPLVPGQKVEIDKERTYAEKKVREFEIVYEDPELIVIDKQAGLLSIATENEKRDTAYSMLSDHVKQQDKANKIFIVHRLDRDTSGLMLFAKNEAIKRKLQDSWNDTIIDRSYLAVVEGTVEKPEGVIISYLFEDKSFKMHSLPNPGKGQKAVTHFTTLKKNKKYSLLKINLETGRKNQIRVHMQDIGHSVVGDKKYGAVSNPLRRLGLHAQQLSFIHPTTGKKLNFETAVPSAFSKLF